MKDLVNLDSASTQIVKFHGDFDDYKSIVLTESSYFERLDFEQPLDIKLRSDVLGKTILFIGYSLNDINIRFLLYKLNKIWINSNYQDCQPKSYIFLGTPNMVQQEVLEARGIKTIISESDNVKEGVIEFLKNLK